MDAYGCEQGTNPTRPAAVMSASVVKKLLELHWSKDKATDGAKINPDAVKLAAEYLRLFVIGESLFIRSTGELVASRSFGLIDPVT